jgi:hypothetical protein
MASQPRGPCCRVLPFLKCLKLRHDVRYFDISLLHKRFFWTLHRTSTYFRHEGREASPLTSDIFSRSPVCPHVLTI